MPDPSSVHWKGHKQQSATRDQHEKNDVENERACSGKTLEDDALTSFRLVDDCSVMGAAMCAGAESWAALAVPKSVTGEIGAEGTGT